MQTHLVKVRAINVTIEVMAALLVVLFIYTAVSKWLTFDDFQGQMRNQAIPSWLALMLIWGLPPIEIATGIALCFRRSRLAGFWSSTLLMAIFTGYILLVICKVFDRVPCSCGGVIKSLGWTAHLYFNLFFLGISVAGVHLSQKQTSDLK